MQPTLLMEVGQSFGRLLDDLRHQIRDAVGSLQDQLLEIRGTEVFQSQKRQLSAGVEFERPDHVRMFQIVADGEFVPQQGELLFVVGVVGRQHL